MTNPRRLILMFVVFPWLGNHLAAEEVDDVRERRQAHEQAIVAAEQLVTTILDHQLRQLEENGLTGHAVYTELQTARGQLQRLVTTEMRELTALLQAADANSDTAREALLSDARTLARRIAVSLLVERQRLQQRLQVSRAATLLKDMIALQVQALDLTTGLASRPVPTRRRIAFQATQTQLDVTALFDQLVIALEDPATSPISAGPSLPEVRHLLVSNRIRERLQSTVEQLQADEFANAVIQQREVLSLLQQALSLFERTRERQDAARTAALQSIQELSQDQQVLRDESERKTLTDAAERLDLSDKQKTIADRLAELRQPLSEVAQVGEQLLAAADAARQAGAHLAGGDKALARERQDTVLNLLDDLARSLQETSSDPQALADRAQKLESLGDSLNELVEQQAEASALAGNDPQAAKEIEDAVAMSLDETDDAGELGQAVESRLNQAKSAVDAARSALQDEAPQAKADRLQAVEKAERALMEAAAEVQSQLADAQRAMEQAESSTDASSSDSAMKNPPSTGATRDVGATGNSAPSASVEPRRWDEEPWFHRLPADLQAKFRGATRRPPPRGYEDKLQRYFSER